MSSTPAMKHMAFLHMNIKKITILCECKQQHPYISQQKEKILYQTPFTIRLCMLNYTALSRGDGGSGHPTLRPYCQMPGGFCPREPPAGGDQQVSPV
jgi:hypothetical protein